MRCKHTTAMCARSGRGWTLVELAVTLVIAGLLASLAWPSFSHALQRSRRADAALSLHRLHAAQEHYHAVNGFYAQRLGLLSGMPARSESNAYRLELVAADATGFTARAVADGPGNLAPDPLCARLTLRVAQGLSHHEPASACWNE